MKKYTLKISKMALYGVLALSLVTTSQTECLFGNSNPAQSFIGKELNLVNQTFDFIIKWYNNLFLSSITFNKAADQLQKCVSKAESDIIAPMHKQYPVLSTRSSSGDNELLSQGQDLINDISQILSDFNQRVNALVGCKERMRFVSGLKGIENTLSARFTALGAKLNQFYNASKQHDASYVKQIEKLLQKIEALSQQTQGIDSLVIYRRICTFVKE